MTWAEISIHTTHEALEAINNILYDAGANGVVIEDPLDLVKERQNHFGEIYELDSSKYPAKGIYIKVYFPNNHLLENKIQKIKKSIEQLDKFGIDIGENKIVVNRVEEEDWETAWQKYYTPVKISNKITIVPNWHKYKPVSNIEKIVYLDPGMAFGTGTHPTTKLSVLALEKYLRHSNEVIDVGCGSGVLSIVSCLLGAKNVLALDLDDIAVKSTKLNRELNHLNEKIKVQQNDLLTGIHLKADLIVANILADIVIDLINDAWNNLKNGGLFIASGIILQEKQNVVDALEIKGFKMIEIKQMKNWLCMIAKKE